MPDIVQTRTITQYRCVPTYAFNGLNDWFPAGGIGGQQLVAGQFAPGAIDQFGVQYVRSISGGALPQPYTTVDGNSDNIVPPFVAQAVGSFPYGFDGANWDRQHVRPVNAGYGAANVNGLVSIANANAYIPGLNAYAPVEGTSFNAATIVQGAGTVSLNVNAANYLNDGSATAVAAVAADSTTFSPGVIPAGVQIVTPRADWIQNHAPAANVLATTTRAAGGANVRHVCTGIMANILCVAGAAASIEVVLRNGASGAGAIIWQEYIVIAAGIGNFHLNLTGLNIVGAANTAMTLEMSAAGGANTFERVNLTGYTVPA